MRNIHETFNKFDFHDGCIEQLLMESDHLWMKFRTWQKIPFSMQFKNCLWVSCYNVNIGSDIASVNISPATQCLYIVSSITANNLLNVDESLDDYSTIEFIDAWSDTVQCTIITKLVIIEKL